MCDDDSNKSVESLDTHCYLIRQALDLEEQIALFEDIQRKDHQSTSKDNPPKPALYPSPRTVQLGGDGSRHKSKIKYEKSAGEPTVYHQLVDKVNDKVLAMTATVDLSDYKSITLSAIEYKAETHTLTEHVDHDDSFVYLLSIGCRTNFVIQGPNMADKRCISLASGDLVVFDASTKGNVLHGIEHIGSECPSELVDHFPILRNHRYGIQLRVRS